MTGRWQGTGGRSLAHRNPRLRRQILDRDPTCRLQTHCDGERSVEVDHIVEVIDGGSDHPANLQGVCARCHMVKTQARAHRGRPRLHRAAEPHPGIRTARRERK